MLGEGRARESPLLLPWWISTRKRRLVAPGLSKLSVDGGTRPADLPSEEATPLGLYNSGNTAVAVVDAPGTVLTD